MMADVDALAYRFGSFIATHCGISNLLYKRDRGFIPLVYEWFNLFSNATSRLTPPNSIYPTSPILTSTFLISNIDVDFSKGEDVKSCMISSIPIMFHTSKKLSSSILNDTSEESEMKIISDTNYLLSEWWVIDDSFGSSKYESNESPSITSR